jgi:GT2 family glycosyltransferase
LGHQNILISVVVSSYKRFDHIKALIESFRNEFLPGEFEVVAVCSDMPDTEKALWLTRQSEVNAIFVGDRKEGQPRAKSLYVYENIGIKSAKGEWILITNDDTIVEPGTREAFHKATSLGQVVVFPTEVDDPSMGKRVPIIGEVLRNGHRNEIPLLDFAAFHRDVFEELGGADEAFDWYGRGADMGVRVVLSQKFDIVSLDSGGLTHKLVLEARRPPHPARDFSYLETKWRQYQESQPETRISFFGPSLAGKGETFYTKRVWPGLNALRLFLRSIYRDTY